MKLYFLIVIIFLFLYTQRKLLEPVILSCCGGMSMARGDYSETDINPPKKWKRCFKPNEWDSFPCTQKKSKKCCGGKGRCRPSKYGGKCEKNDTNADEKFFIYKEDGTEEDYTREMEESDAKNFTDDETDEEDEGDEEPDHDPTDIFYIICFIFIFILFGILVYKFIMGKKKPKPNPLLIKPKSAFEYKV